MPQSVRHFLSQKVSELSVIYVNFSSLGSEYQFWLTLHVACCILLPFLSSLWQEDATEVK